MRLHVWTEREKDLREWFEEALQEVVWEEAKELNKLPYMRLQRDPDGTAVLTDRDGKAFEVWVEVREL